MRERERERERERWKRREKKLYYLIGLYIKRKTRVLGILLNGLVK